MNRPQQPRIDNLGIDPMEGPWIVAKADGKQITLNHLKRSRFLLFMIDAEADLLNVLLFCLCQ
jgi:hypothetical protein